MLVGQSRNKELPTTAGSVKGSFGNPPGPYVKVSTLPPRNVSSHPTSNQRYRAVVLTVGRVVDSAGPAASSAISPNVPPVVVATTVPTIASSQPPSFDPSVDPATSSTLVSTQPSPFGLLDRTDPFQVTHKANR